MNKALLVRGLFVACVAAYPILVFLGLQYLPPSFFGLLLIVILGLRLGVLVPAERAVLLPMLSVFGAYAVLTAVLNNEWLVKLYPVLVNFFLCAVFALSLRQEQSLLLRLVRARGIKTSEYAPRYLHRLTGLWAVFFVLNGLVSLWTATRSLEVWTLYNGLVAYLLAGTFFIIEYIYRRHYKKKMGVLD